MTTNIPEYWKLELKLDNHMYTFSKQQQPTSELLWPKQNGEYFTLTATVLQARYNGFAYFSEIVIFIINLL